MQLTERDLAILLDLYHWRAMLSEQLRRKHFTSGAYAYKRLEDLAGGGYVKPRPYLVPWKGNRKKKAATYYELTEQGMRVLKEAKLVDEPRPARKNRLESYADFARADLAFWPGVVEGREAKRRNLVAQRFVSDAYAEGPGGPWHLYVRSSVSRRWLAVWKDRLPVGKHLFLAPNDEAYHQMEEVLRGEGVHLLPLSAAREAQRLILDPLWAYRETAAALESYWPRAKVIQQPSGWFVERREQRALLLETITGNLATLADVRSWHPDSERSSARPTYLIVAVKDRAEAARLTHELAVGAGNAVSFWCMAEGEIANPALLAGRAS